jgi:voltage-gated potassium channel
MDIDNKQEAQKDGAISFATITISFMSIVTLATVFFHYVEDWRWLDSIYFVIVTVATVGYGNLAPETDIGKIANIIVIIVGIGLFGVFANQLLKRQALKRLERQRKQRKH